jgi:2-amino-4-hydroxy-6-hydroxymethyldihydropteridine diphosphokinase
MVAVFLGLGSNIDPAANLKHCAALLREAWPDIVFSPVYESAPREVTDQPAFLNAVARIETEQPPEAVADQCRAIEAALGKDPPFRFGPRTIDIDVLLYGDKRVEEEDLLIPHPRLAERRFVLEPLVALTGPETKHPLFPAAWEDLRQKTLDQPCAKTAVSL